MFQLKKGKEGFTVVEGPFAGRSYERGRLYNEIPPQHAGKFEDVNKAAPVQAAVVADPVQADSKEAVADLPLSGKKGGR